MFKITEIIQKNRETYYDYSSGRPRSVAGRYVLILILALVFTASFEVSSDKFLSILATSLAILLGFLFSVLFFMVSVRLTLVVADNDSIERELRCEKLKKLGWEIFYNVSYLILVFVGALFFALLRVLITEASDLPKLVIQFFSNRFESDQLQAVLLWLIALAEYAKWLVEFLIVFLTSEALLGFVRLLQRISFYFSERIDLEGTTPPSP